MILKIKNNEMLNHLDIKKIQNKKFLYLFYYIALRNLINFYNIIFSFLLPFIWLFVGYAIWAKTSNEYGSFYFYTFFTSLSLMPMASLAIMGLPFALGMDRISNITKIYSTLNISIWSYYLANYLFTLLEFLFIFNLILLVGNFGITKLLPISEFGTHLHLLIESHILVNNNISSNFMTLSAAQYFELFFTNIYIFTSLFILGIGLSYIGNKYNTLNIGLSIVYYVNLFFSGTMIPVFAFDPSGFLNPDGLWFKWIQYIIPLGCGARLLWNITIPAYWTWNSDWLCFVIPIIEDSLVIYSLLHSNVIKATKKHRIEKNLDVKTFLETPINIKIYKKPENSETK